MDNQALNDLITDVFPTAEIITEDTQFLNAIIHPDLLRDVACFLKDDDRTKFDFMFCLTCVDYPEHMMMVYHLRSTGLEHEMVLKVKIEDRERAEVETVSDLWRTAEYLEREVYDLFGVRFTNHPDLRRLLLTDDWEGYPLRKDYEDPVNMISL